MRHSLIGCLFALAACGDNVDGPARDCGSWRQWGGGPGHVGTSCAAGQPLKRELASFAFDPFLAQEVADAQGNLIVHYQVPLVDGDALFMMQKKGTYTPCAAGPDGPVCNTPEQLYRLNSQVWSEQRYTIGADGALTPGWSFDSDWKPTPQAGFEPMFQPALVGEMIAIPGAGGAIWLLDAQSGAMVRHVQPFGAAIDPDTYVAGGIAVAPDGTIYYNTLKLDHDRPMAMPAQAHLVAVAPDGTIRTADYATLVPGAPAADASCFRTYNTETTPLPWPPANPDGSIIPPPSSPCGGQRPGVNTTPAIGADGTVFVVSRAHFNARYSYVVAVGANLAPRWATSLRDYLRDGCGVTLDSDGTATERTTHCRVGTPVGLERVTGFLPAPTVEDASSSSPVALPDGGVLYGALSGYNGSRGHLMKLDATGALAGSYDFGWDSTPAVLGTGSDYKIIVKDNHYGKNAEGVDLGPFYITQLNAALRPVWKFASTNTRSCERKSDGSVACADDHPNGFEWCINAPAVDRDGNVYVNAEDGNAYVIGPDGKQRDVFFLDRAIGAAYTPTALDPQGRMIALNAGRLWLLGR